jgi:RNA polymerase sigma-70 factor, ECF subfamily
MPASIIAPSPTAAPAHPDPVSDERLMRRLRDGDVDAFATLYERYYRLIVSVARRYVHDAAAAEDIAQDCFLSLWKHRRGYRSELGSPRTWLMAVTHNRAIDATRRAKTRPQIAGDLDDARSLAAADDVAADVERRESSRRTRAAIDALPRPQREVLSLSAYGGLSHSEIARLTGSPLGTVKGRSRLGMAKLRAGLAA